MHFTHNSSIDPRVVKAWQCMCRTYAPPAVICMSHHVTIRASCRNFCAGLDVVIPILSACVLFLDFQAVEGRCIRGQAASSGTLPVTRERGFDLAREVHRFARTHIHVYVINVKLKVLYTTLHNVTQCGCTGTRVRVTNSHPRQRATRALIYHI